MTNHDHTLPSGQKPPAITTLSESISAWMRQATYVDMSPITTQAQMIADIIKPDYTNMVAGLAEISKVSLATQAQAIADAFKPDYTDIFANLSDFSTISNAMQVQALKEITKPNANELFASLAKISMPTNELFASLAKISMPTMVGTIKFDFNNKAHTPFAYAPNHHQKTELVAAIWYTAYDLDTLRRREKVVAILKETGIHYETPLFGAYDSYMHKHIDYERHTLSSMRTIFEKLIYRCVRGIHKIQIISILQKAGIPEKKYTDDEKRFIRSRAAVYYLTLHDSMQDKTIRKRLINLSMELNKVHDENIQITDKKLYMVILEMEVMICEVFSNWLNPGLITPSC